MTYPIILMICGCVVFAISIAAIAAGYRWHATRKPSSQRQCDASPDSGADDLRGRGGELIFHIGADK